MKKLKTTPLKGADVSGHGLTDADAAKLEDALAGLRPLVDRRHLLGGADAAKVLDIERRLKARLEPQSPEGLVAETRKIIDTYAPTLARSREKALELEAHMAAIAAKRQAHAEAVAQTRAERAEQQRLRRQQG